MKDSNLFDINRDDEFLDELAGLGSGERIPDLRTDPLFVDLSLWTASIDADVLAARELASEEESVAEPEISAASSEAGRHRRDASLARAGRRSVRAGFVVAAAGAALSFSGVAAAVNGGHLPQLPEFHFPATPTPAKGASVLADVPSAVPTSPVTRPGHINDGLNPAGRGDGRSRPGTAGSGSHESAAGTSSVERPGNSPLSPSTQGGQSPADTPVTTPKPSQKWTSSVRPQGKRHSASRAHGMPSRASQSRPTTPGTVSTSGSSTSKPAGSRQGTGTPSTSQTTGQNGNRTAGSPQKSNSQGAKGSNSNKAAAGTSTTSHRGQSARQHSSHGARTSSARTKSVSGGKQQANQARSRRYLTERSGIAQPTPAATPTNDVTSNTTGG